MDELKYKDVDGSSLIGLKAELYRKQELLKQAKLNQSNEPLKKKGFKLKGEDAFIKAKNISSPLRVTTAEEENEEEKELKRSRLALERKSKLYERIMSKKITLGDEDGETYMVDFQRKLNNAEKEEPVNSTESSSENNNIVVQQDIQLPSHVANINPPHEYYSSFVKGSNNGLSTPSSDARVTTSSSDQKESETDGPIHYQNVQQNEVRDHGVGYYAFSQDAEKRKEQMDLLNTLRQKTEQKQTAVKKMKEKRSVALHARLAKVCQRRNIDVSNIDRLVPINDTEVDDLEQNAALHDVDINEIPLPVGEAAAPPPPKPVKVRPWDEGKDLIDLPDVPSKKRCKVTQKDWIEERRSERVDEFGPPVNF